MYRQESEIAMKFFEIKILEETTFTHSKIPGTEVRLQIEVDECRFWVERSMRFAV